MKKSPALGNAKPKTALLALALVLASSLAARAAAPPGRYTVNANNTVLDNRTGLTWQQGSGPSTVSQPDAASYCAGLPLAGGGWRLPKVSELRSLQDPTQFNTSIDRTAFPGTSGSQYWSSTPAAKTAGFFFLVNFYNGSAGEWGPTNLLYVRCVR